MAFEAASPRILGALYNAVASALRNLSSTKLLELPRMADFALWATAAESGLELKAGQFIAAYAANREAGNEMALDASPIGKTLVTFVDQVGEWCGSAAELLKELNRKSEESVHYTKSWPQTARSLGTTVRRIAPNLRQTGIDVEFGHDGRDRRKRRVIRLARKGAESTVPIDPSVPDTGNHTACGDDGDDALPGGDDLGTQIPFDVTPCDATPGTSGDDGDAEIRSESGHIPRNSTLHGLCTGRLTPGMTQPAECVRQVTE